MGKQIINMHKLKIMSPEKLAKKLESILQGDTLYRRLDKTVVDFSKKDKPNNNPGVI